MLGALLVCCVLASAPASEASSEAEALFRDGQAKYETHDYDGAIDAFTAAYARAEEIEGDALREQVLSRLSFNLARAHVSAYDVDRDPQHLELARRLLADYRGHERALGRDPDADTDVLRLESDLAEREAQREDASATTGDSTASTARNRARRQAGISLLVLSAPLGGVAVVGAVIGARAKSEFETVTTGDARRSAQTRGRTGDVLFGVGLGLAVLSAATGATLLGVSMQSKRGRASARIAAGGLMIEGAF